MFATPMLVLTLNAPLPEMQSAVTERLSGSDAVVRAECDRPFRALVEVLSTSDTDEVAVVLETVPGVASVRSAWSIVVLPGAYSDERVLLDTHPHDVVTVLDGDMGRVTHVLYDTLELALIAWNRLVATPRCY